MPGSGLSNVVVLGDTTGYSRAIFEQLFRQPSMMPRFKHSVSTSADRWKHRAAAKRATVAESARMVFTGTTNYDVILRDLIAQEEQGSLALVGNFRFMINASHEAVRKDTAGHLMFLASDQALTTPADYLHQPVHRLLVEEHVYAFVWSPTDSTAYKAVRAAVAVARLASSVASTVATLGASAPALIDSLQYAATVASDLVKLKSAVSTSVSTLLQVKEAVSGVVDDLTEAQERVSALTEPGGARSDTLAGAARTQPLDLTARAVAVAPQSVKVWKGLRGSRTETDKERLARVGKQLGEMEKEAQSLNFIVVQHITPVVQLRDNVDITSPTDTVISFNFKTYLAKRALVRVGESSRDLFNQMVAVDKADALTARGMAEVLCRPWAAGGVFLQFMRQPHEELVTPRPYPASSVPFVHWNDLTKPEWELVDEKRDTMPLPESLLRARADLQARQREAQALAARRRDQALMRWGQRARGTLLQAQTDRLRRINEALRVSAIPSVPTFKALTTTTTLGITNARSNPKLLLIDLALMTWETARRQDAGTMGVEQMVGALKALCMACEDFLTEKQQKAQRLFGHSSARIEPVQRLLEESRKVHDILQREVD